MSTIERVSITDLLERAVEHEQWLAPLEPKLRLGLFWASGGMAAAIPVGFLGAELYSSWTYGGFFFFLGPVAIWFAAFLCSPLGIVLNVAGLAFMALLYQKSQGFAEATIPWQRLGIGLVGVGAADILAMTLPLAIVALNLIVWALLVALVFAVVSAVLAAPLV